MPSSIKGPLIVPLKPDKSPSKYSASSISESVDIIL